MNSLGSLIGLLRDTGACGIRDSYSVKAPPCVNPKSAISRKTAAQLILQSHTFLIFWSLNHRFRLKMFTQVIRNFCSIEGIKRVFPKKDFRTALESEGYRIKNSSKHANQLRIFAEDIGSVKLYGKRERLSFSNMNEGNLSL